MIEARKSSQNAASGVWCEHDPACRDCGHCVDNMGQGQARRPTRADMLRWLASQR